MFRLIIEIILRIIGYVVFFNALGGAAEGDPITFLMMFGLADLLLIGGAVIGSGERWHKPTFTTPVGAFFGWIFFILVAPFIYLVRDVWGLFKFIITLPFTLLRGRKGSSRGSRGSSSGGSIGANHSSSYSDNRARGGERVFNRAVGNICYRYSGTSSLGVVTSVKYSFSHSIISHSITLTVDMRFTVKEMYIHSEYDAQKERSSIENYISNFNFDPIKNAIGEELEKLRTQYDDLDDAWGIQININPNIETV